MRITKKDVHDLTRGILIIFGGLFLGIILHEIYHSLTLQDVQSICLMFGTNNIAHVAGNGFSSEPVAYTITIVVALLVTIFAAKDVV
jgi:hypothetical protein